MPRRSVFAAWASILLGCGQIREVPVELGVTSTGAGGSTATGTAGPGRGSTTCPNDCDTETRPETTTSGESSSSTTASPPGGVDDRTVICSGPSRTPLIAGDPAGSTVSIVVEDEREVTDVDVLVRVSHEQPSTVHLVLERERSQRIDLVDGGDPDVRCGAGLRVRFDDEADVPASELCSRQTETELSVVAPEMPLKSLVGDTLGGVWTLAAIVPAADAGNGALESFCLSVAEGEG